MKMNEMMDIHVEETKKEKYKKLQKNMRKLIDDNVERKTMSLNKQLPLSLVNTKLELPILYSNLVSIEDMKFENSGHYICSNGFLTSSIRLKSIKHNNIEYTDCLFRVFPKTYNFNKYKVLNYIHGKQANFSNSQEEEDINFKLESEIDNNFDIIQSKIGEPVYIGDIVMLMHESTHKFLKYQTETKKLVLSNHDSEDTIFMIDQGGEIMQNDNQIVKSGQPIRLKVASFNNLHKQLYLSLYFPLSEEEMDEEKEDCLKFNDLEKKYLIEPEVILEESSNMKWRFNLFSTFTEEENTLFYGNCVNIVHCGSYGYLSSEQIGCKYRFINKELLAESSRYKETEESSMISLFNQSEFDDQFEHNDELLGNNFDYRSKFYLKIYDDIKEEKTDVNSCWIIESILEDIKHLSFIRYHEESHLDTYRMAFRLKNFKTNKYLSLLKLDYVPDSEELKQPGYFVFKIDDVEKYYKFGLVDGSNGKIKDDYTITSQYQYSLFAFYPSIKDKVNHFRVEKNHFIRIYHIATKSFLKLIYNKSKKVENYSIDAVLTLSKNFEDQDIFKIISNESEKVWSLNFLKNCFNLLGSIIHHITCSIGLERLNTSRLLRRDSSINNLRIEEEIRNSSQKLNNIKYGIIKSVKFILDKLNKFITNQFINKLETNNDYDLVVFERQLLISKFGFSNMILEDFIFNFWIKNDMENYKLYLNLLMNELAGKNIDQIFNNLPKKDQILIIMYNYTESFFEFLYFYCKDNVNIKNELYEYFYVFFFFINLSKSCIKCLIEIIKDNPNILREISYDCKKKKNFKDALALLNREYFNINEEMTIIELIFEYIKISKFENEIYSEYNKASEEFVRESKIYSTNSRENYFTVLKELVNEKYYNNIIDNKQLITHKLFKQGADHVISLVDFLEKSSGSMRYPPSLIELIVCIATNHPNRLISNYMENNFFSINLKIDEQQLEKKNNYYDNEASKLRAACYFIDIYDEKSLNEYKNVVESFLLELTNDSEKRSFNFNNNSKVNLIINVISFLRTFYKKMFFKLSIPKQSKLVNHLVSILNYNYFKFFKNMKTNSKVEEKTKKLANLKEKIYHSKYSNYYTISRSWFNTLIVFKTKLLNKKLEESTFKHSISIKKLNSKGVKEMEDKNRYNEKNKILDEIDDYFFDKKSRMKLPPMKKKTLFRLDDVNSISDKNNKSVLNNVDYNQVSYNNEKIIQEDKNRLKREIITSILDLFNLFLTKNHETLIINFINYYQNKNIKNLDYKDFLSNCVLPLEFNHVSHYAEKFLSEDDNTFNSNLEDKIFNLNKIYICEGDKNLTFVHNLMIAFNISQDLELQNNILRLIYRIFTQRKRFFNTLLELNDYTIKQFDLKFANNTSNLEYRLNNNIEIYLNSFEKIKKETNNDFFKSLYTFSHSLIKETLNLLISDTSEKTVRLIDSSVSFISKKIFEHVNELDKIKDIDVGISNELFYSIITNFFYFHRENSNYSIFFSIQKLNNNCQRLMNLMEYFFEVGNKLISDNNKKFTQYKMEFFMNFSLLFIIYLLLFQKHKKNLVFLTKMLSKYTTIINLNNHIFFMLLLSITDYQSENFNLNYSDIMFYLREFNFEVLKNQKNYDDDHNKLGNSLFRNNYLSEMNDIPRLYLDILNKTLDYVIRYDKIILENNVDFHIIDNINHFFSYYNYTINDTDLIYKVLRIFVKINKVEKLIRNFKANFEKNKYTIKIPQPNLVFKLLRKNCEINSITGYKNIMLLIKYFVIYYHLDKGYFYSEKGQEHPQNYVYVFICLIIRGIKDDDNGKILPGWEYGDDAKVIIESDGYLLILLYLIYVSIKKKEHLEIFSLEYASLIKLLQEYLTIFIEKYKNSSQDNMENVYYILKKLKSYKDRKKFTLKTNSKEKVSKEIHSFKKLYKNSVELLSKLEVLINQKKNSQKEMYQHFKENILESNKNKIIELGNNESDCFVYYIFLLMERDNEYHDILYDFLNRIVDFIYKSCSYSLPLSAKKINIFLLYTLSKFMAFFDENENSVHVMNFKKKTLLEIQVVLSRTGMIEKFLKLINSKNDNQEEINDILPYIFDNFNLILKRGSNIIQKIFYKNFTNSLENEIAFKYIYQLIQEKISNLISYKTYIIRLNKLKIKKKLRFKFLKTNFERNLDSRVLRFLQLLCENHNSLLQNYLGYQFNFRKSYNLISITNQYLQQLYHNKEGYTFSAVMKCLDCLVEFIQGPCLENQNVLMNSKLISTISEILDSFISEEECDKEEQKTKLTVEKSIMTYKTAILLLSLVEGRTNDDKIYDSFITNLNPTLLPNVILKIYKDYVTIIKTNYDNQIVLRIRDLNKIENLIDAYYDYLEDNESDENFTNENILIIETGFYIFFFYKYLEDYKYYTTNKNLKKGRKAIEIAENNKFENKSKKDYFLSNFFIFFYFFFELLVSTINLLTLMVSGLIYVITCGNFYSFDIKRLFVGTKVSNEIAFNFFEKYSRSMEILRDENVYKIYFILLPFCKSFSDFDKNLLLENMDRTNSKTKLTDILKASNRLKHELEMDYKVKVFLNKIPTFGIVFKYIHLWKDISLFLAIFQNLLILVSIRKDLNNGEIIREFLHYTNNDIEQLVFYINIIQLMTSGFIVFEFFFRKVPSIVKIINENAKDLQMRSNSTLRRKWYYVSQFIEKTFLNIEVVYYTGYQIFSIMGMISSDFFFCFLLFEVVMRYKTLKNVLMSIRNPINELFLTLIFWLLLTYYLAIICYTFFMEYLYKYSDCSNISKCLFILFYQNNKIDAGIGGYLKHAEINDNNHNPVLPIFWYAQINIIIVKILVTQMVAGIIIDNFAKLRNQELAMINDMTNICTVCSLKRDEIEKIYEKFSKTYNDHVRVDHNIFNYIYYIIYLHFKDKTEYTGMESYVYDLVFNQRDITWFPINKMYLLKKDEVSNNQNS